MYRVKGAGSAASLASAASAAASRTSFGAPRGARLRWWAAAAALALAVLGVFTAVTLWLGFSVTGAAPTAPASASAPAPAPAPAPDGGEPAPASRPRARQATPETALEALAGRVREAGAPPPSRPAPAPAPTAPPLLSDAPAPEADSPQPEGEEAAAAADADPRFDHGAAYEDTTPTFEDENSPLLVPTAEDVSELDTSEQRFYIDDVPDSSGPPAPAPSPAPSPAPARAAYRPAGAPPIPRPIPETPTVTFPMDANVAPTVPAAPATPPTRFDLGTPSAGGAPQRYHLPTFHADAPAGKPQLTLKDFAKQHLYERRKDDYQPEVRRIDDYYTEVRRIGEAEAPGIRRVDDLNDGPHARLAEESDPASVRTGQRRADAESESELKKHLLLEIKAAHGRDRLGLSEASPTDAQLNEFLLREMTRDSRREELVPREVAQADAGNLLRRDDRYPSPAAERAQYYVQEAPAPSPAPPGSGSAVSAFLQQRVQELQAWLGGGVAGNEAAAAADAGAGGGGNGPDLRAVLASLQTALREGDATPMLARLRELYYRGGGGGAAGPAAALRNSSSLLSLGLLAFDLLLLHNVQQIAWGEEPDAGRAMLQDPEVAALNALFVDPAQLRATHDDPVLAALDLQPGAAGGGGPQDLSLLEELVEFVKSAARAVLSLGRAYRSGGGVLDCVWTLYCRNLDKTARMRGPYGFLARLNGLGLRLLMGEFPLETALDTILREMAHGWTSIDCANFFPKCSPEVATRVVLRTALGAASEESLALEAEGAAVPTTGAKDRTAASPSTTAPPAAAYSPSRSPASTAAPAA